MAGGRISRDPGQGIVAGVCAGFARRFVLDPVLVRVVTAILIIATGGLAALGYLLLWAALPTGRRRTDDETAISGSWGARRANRRRSGDDRRASPTSGTGTAAKGDALYRGSWLVGAGAGLTLLGLLFVFRGLDIWWSDSLGWPLVLATAGAALVWRQFSGAGEAGDETAGRRSRRSRLGPYRGWFGVALLLAAGVLFLYVNGALEAGGKPALAGLTAVVVLGLVLAPIWARLAGRLSAERAERIRSQERAEVAAHLHDSVLQTLALIQKNPGDSRRVSTLARSQERELRQWLAGGSPAGTGRTLAPALEQAAAEVEELHQTPIEVVTVGDRPLDERFAALLAAGREALTNAARHAGDGGPISLYAEISPEQVQVFIRDRGAGFDPEAITPGRHGLRDSIVGRMERNGGRAEIRSEPGEGTEIELTMEAR